MYWTLTFSDWEIGGTIESLERDGYSLDEAEALIASIEAFLQEPHV